MRMRSNQDTHQGAITSFLVRNIHFLVHNFKLNRALMSFVVTTTDKETVQRVAKIVEDYRLRATFAFSTSFIGTEGMADNRDILSLSKKNHEIALQSHRAEVVSKMSESSLNIDLHRSLREIYAMTGNKSANFIYPQGLCSFANKFRMGSKMRSAVSSLKGINHGITDLQYLKSAPLKNCDEIEYYINKTREYCGFLIFKINEETPEQMIRYAIDAALMRGISIYTLNDALDFAGVPQQSARSFRYSSTPETDRISSKFNMPMRKHLRKA